MTGSKGMEDVLRVFFSDANRSDRVRIDCTLLQWRRFPANEDFRIAEIGVSGAGIEGVCSGFGMEEWRIRWVLPKSLDDRFFSKLPGCASGAFLYPLWLTREPAFSSMPIEDETECSFGYDSPPDAERCFTLPSWWVVASQKWRLFVKSCMPGEDAEGVVSGKGRKGRKKGGRSIRLEELIRLESGLNGLFTDYSGRQECGAQEADASWNGLKLLEEKRRVDVDWWGRQQGRLRRPHLSHERKLCPFQTPESTRIGLQMYLAADAEPHDGQLTEGKSVFSAATGLIPYPLHTDGPRLLMGGKNMKQAEAVIASPEPPLVPGYLEGGFMEELCCFPSDRQDGRRFYPFLGRNVWTAVMPFDGFTYEDGLVVSESLASALCIYSYCFGEKKYFRGLSLDAAFRDRDSVSLRRLMDDEAKVFLRDAPFSLRFGDPLPLEIFARFFENGEETLRSSFFSRLSSELVHMESFPSVARDGRVDLEIRIEYSACLPLTFGDKLTGRSGNKGVVTRVLADSERPVAKIAGRDVPVDLMISPCSILGRKNLGQILEMLHALLLKGEEWGAPMRRHPPKDRAMTSKEIQEKAIPELQASLGADGEGLFPVRFADGRSTFAFVAPQYFMRLHHHAVKKIQARGASGPVNEATGLPDRGGARTAQRMGEMEHWSLLSYPDGSGEALLFSLRENRGAREGVERMRRLLRLILIGMGLFLEEGKAKAKAKDSLSLRPLSGDCADAMRKSGFVVDEMSVDEAEQKLRKLSEDDGDELLDAVWRISSVSKASRQQKRIMETKTASEAAQQADMAPGAVVKELLGKGFPLFGEDDALWVSPGLLYLHRELLGSMGREAPKTGLLRLLDGLKRWSKFGGEKKSVEKILQRYRKSLVALLAGKEGLVRQSMMGRRFAASGRGVIVPEPELAPDEVFLPLTQFAGMLSGAPDVRKRLSARCGDGFLIERLREWMEPEEVVEAVRVLDDLLRIEPVWCLLIRQPSLHRHSVQAYRVRIWEKNVIGLPPLVTAGFNADFDGDTMAVFLPPEPFACNLAPLSLLENPGIVGTGAPAFATGLDLALGWNSLPPEEKNDFFKAAGCPFDASMTFKTFFPKLLRALGGFSLDERREKLRLLQKKICFSSTGEGSLGPVVFQRLCDDFRASFKEDVAGFAGCSDEEYDRCLSRANEVLKKRVSGAISLLVGSGAKGGPDDLRAMGAFLGRQRLFQQDEQDVPEEAAVRGFITSNLWEGLSEKEMFVYSYASRDSMAAKKLAVAEAGYLSRLLAEGLFETSVTTGDCGASRGISIALRKDGSLVVGLSGSTCSMRFPTMGGVLDDLHRIAWGRVPVGMSRCLNELDLQQIADSWRGKGDIADDELRAHIVDRNGTIEIRSPLGCRAASPGVCALCCGADLARKPFDDPSPLPVGARVGLTAAQAIGERGTQLAMKRFHQVGDPKDVPGRDGKKSGEHDTRNGVPAVLRALLVDADPALGKTREERLGSLFEKVLASGKDEKDRIKAEKDLPQNLIHFEIALRPENGLYCEAENRIANAFLSRLAFEGAGEVLKKIGSGCYDDLKSVKSRLLWS